MRKLLSTATATVRWQLRFCAWFVLLSLGVSSAASAAISMDEMKSLIRASGINLSHLSMLVVDGNDDDARTLLDIHSTTPKIPASVTKLVTSAASLYSFPTDMRFRTQLLGDGRISGHTLKGNLILRGLGDPVFTSESMMNLVTEMAHSGIRTITGDIVVDDNYFDDVRIDPTRTDSDSTSPYNAPVGAMSFNWNSVKIIIAPGEDVGDPARVMIDPPSDYIRVDGEIETVRGSRRSRARAMRTSETGFAGDVIKVGGSMGVNASNIYRYITITKPALWSGYNLKVFLKRQGITVQGSVRRGDTPDGADLLALHRSRTVEEILRAMNKNSNNFIAEMLAKNLATRNGEPATMAGGMSVVSDYMHTLNVSDKQYKLVNPSGLTRHNLISAKALVRVLQDMGGSFRHYPEFMASLPIAGIDGTLHRRMKNTRAEGWVRAKTGYINDVVSLAGYAGNDDGSYSVFAFLYNGRGAVWKVQQLFDRICMHLTQH